MPLCQMCQAIPPSLFEGSTTHFHVHHPSLKSLETSAKEGCRVCSLLHEKTVNDRFKNLYPCGGTAGPDYLAQLEAAQTYSGIPQYIARNDGHRTYMQIFRFKEKPYDGWVHRLSYQLGRKGYEHRFDIEFSDSLGSSTLHPLGEVTFSSARSWIDECVRSHENCNIQYDTEFVPTRLIDVGPKGTTPRLIKTASVALSDSRYLALSHRWGSSMPESATTRTSTMTRRMAKIPMSTLPDTFREAVTVTRRLGLRYLWIDSLCILQDSQDDWQKESALMGKVYSHSHCMIAAAAASDCFGGLFAKKVDLPLLMAPSDDPNISVVRSALIKPPFSSWNDLFMTNQLNGRGWTLQERELSPRILYFTKHTILFECREGQAGDPSKSSELALSELKPKSLAIVTQGVQRSLDRVLRLQTMIGSSRSTDFSSLSFVRYLGWMQMIEGYSERTLSMPSDKFAGVSGLASEFSYILDDQYVAGLWRKDLCRGLCWRWKERDHTDLALKNQIQTGAMDYGPSWSWAKMVASVSYDLAYDGEVEIDLRPKGIGSDSAVKALLDPKIISVSTVPAGKDPNGTLISATIVLEGLIFRFSRSKTGNLQILGEAVKVFWDFLPQTATTYYVLSLGSTRAGLVLIRDQYYRRAGIIARIEPEWFDESDLQRITLV